MRYVSLFLVILLTSCTQNKKEFYPGELWLDNNQVHINAHGGGILYHNNMYYWVGEHKVEGKEGNKAKRGVGIYSSKDLYNWKDEGIALRVVDSVGHDIEQGCILERPKVIFNEKTQKFVMWFHLELKGQGYKAAKTAVAVSDKVIGPYRYIKSFRPNAGVWPLNYPDSLKNITFRSDVKAWSDEDRKQIRDGKFLHRDFHYGQMSRDMTVFVDEDGTAYHIHSSEENQTLHISVLNEDYTDFTGEYVRVFPGAANEAPAICKRGNKYYMITSGCTGWKPNPGRSAIADSMLGAWKELGNPFKGEGNKISFDSQSTHIIKLDGSSDKFIYMGDRWRPKNAIDGRYVWLPINFKNDTLIINWRNNWNL